MRLWAKMRVVREDGWRHDGRVCIRDRLGVCRLGIKERGSVCGRGVRKSSDRSDGRGGVVKIRLFLVARSSGYLMEDVMSSKRGWSRRLGGSEWNVSAISTAGVAFSKR